MGKNSIRRDTLFAYINLILRIGMGFYTAPLIANAVGKSNYGLMNLILSITSYSVLMQFGINNAVTRYVAKYSAERNKRKESEMVSLTLYFYTCTGIVAFLTGLVIYFNFERYFNILPGQAATAKTAFMICLVNAVVNLTADVFHCFIKGYKKFSYYYTNFIIRIVIRATLLTILLNMGYGIVTVLAVDLILCQMINIALIAYAFRKLKLKLVISGIKKDFIFEIGKYSFYGFLIMIGVLVFKRTDKILLGIMRSTEDVGMYTVSQNLVEYFSTFVIYIAYILLPTLTETVVKDRSLEKAKNILLRVARVQFMIASIAVVNFIFMGKDFIYLWMGPDYVEAYKYAWMVMIPYMFYLIMSSGEELLFAINKHKVRAFIDIGTAGLNLLVSIILIRFFGVIGAAAGTIIALFVGKIILMNIYYKKLLDFKIFKHYFRVCAKTLIAIIPTFLCFMFIEKVNFEVSFTTLAIKAVSCNIPYVVMLYFVALDDTEKLEIRNIRASLVNTVKG